MRETRTSGMLVLTKKKGEAVDTASQINRGMFGSELVYAHTMRPVEESVPSPRLAKIYKRAAELVAKATRPAAPAPAPTRNTTGMVGGGTNRWKRRNF